MKIKLQRITNRLGTLFLFLKESLKYIVSYMVIEEIVRVPCGPKNPKNCISMFNDQNAFFKIFNNEFDTFFFSIYCLEDRRRRIFSFYTKQFEANNKSLKRITKLSTYY